MLPLRCVEAPSTPCKSVVLLLCITGLERLPVNKRPNTLTVGAMYLWSSSGDRRL
jgi:hypothetical protein